MNRPSSDSQSDRAPDLGTPAVPRAAGPIRVLCVDDNQGMIQAMGLMIDGEPTLCCAGTLRSADRLAKLVQEMSPTPDVMVVDARMPRADPFRAVSELSDALPAVRAIFYTGYHDPSVLARARAAGAWGCVSKQEEPDAILHAIQEVAAGRSVWPGEKPAG